ncbi:MAG TPA: mannitol dehydrogenase family protein, partial [Pseudonocardiaceae bacterium]|nr:mannitol dehydrogenase family protein [Pseudonocardiaceae bacterium]
MTGPAAQMPDVPRPDLVGIVHLGLGAFHRAHQAVFTDDAMLATGDRSWGICGVTQRSDDVLRRLAPRDNRYTLLERGPGAAPPRVVGSILDVLPGHRDPAAVVAAIARPSVRIVTLTVTEKGYRHDPATGELDLADPEIRADLAGRPPRTVVGQLAAGIAARGAAPLTVVCCDNLPDNGRFLRGLVERFTGADAPAAVRFPATMVDRIVPAATDADRAEAHDDAVVVAEPFRQWVIEDDFATDRPAWDLVGAEFTADVAPWERLKLRV